MMIKITGSGILPVPVELECSLEDVAQRPNAYKNPHTL